MTLQATPSELAAKGGKITLSGRGLDKPASTPLTDLWTTYRPRPDCPQARSADRPRGESGVAVAWLDRPARIDCPQLLPGGRIQCIDVAA